MMKLTVAQFTFIAAMLAMAWFFWPRQTRNQARSGLRKYLPLLFGLVGIACGASTPTGPTSTATTATVQRSTADEPARGGGLGISCPSDAVVLAAANPNNDKVDFSWYRVLGATGYEVEVYRRGLRTYLADAFNTNGNASVLATRHNYVDGTYHWRVRTRTTCGNGAWSVQGVFSLGERPMEPEPLVCYGPPTSSNYGVPQPRRCELDEE